MNLNEYSAKKRREILDDLAAGRDPREGTWDGAVLAEAKMKSRPQLGPLVFLPRQLELQFLYSDPQGGSLVFTVRLDSPERIVQMPVPSWVIENVWQGEISGSYHFESDALALYEAFRAELEPDANLKHFQARARTTREDSF
jgi:hypothetical protein